MRPYGIDRHIFHVDFSSPAEIAKAGGTVNGSSSFDRQKGMYFDGSTSYIEFPTALLAQDPFVVGGSVAYSFVVEFWPEREDSDSAGEYLFKYGSSAIWYALRLFAPKIRFWFRNDFRDWSMNWNKDQRNVLVLIAKSYDVEGFLNGVSIGTATSNFSGSPVVEPLYIGADNAGNYNFKGWIKSFTVYRHRVTQQEAQDLYSNQTYTYKDKASIWLDMETQTEDSSGNAITKDRSRYGRHFQLGDGTTSSTFPSFENPGFDFDGTDDYMQTTLSDYYTGNVNGYSIVIVFQGGSLVGKYIASIGKAAVNSQAVLYVPTSSLLNFSNYGYDINVDVGSINGRKFVCVLADNYSGKELWVNGKLGAEGAHNPGLNLSQYVKVGCGTANTTLLPVNYSDATVFHFSVFPTKLTPTQIRELTSYLRNKY